MLTSQEHSCVALFIYLFLNIYSCSIRWVLYFQRSEFRGTENVSDELSSEEEDGRLLNHG